MVVGRNGLTGQLVPESVEEESRAESDPVPTHPRPTMVGTVRERISRQENAMMYLAKVSKYIGHKIPTIAIHVFRSLLPDSLQLRTSRGGSVQQDGSLPSD